MARMTRGKQTRIRLVGGPLNGAQLLMQHPESGTLEMTCKAQTGRYVPFMAGTLCWESKNEQWK